jgi:hypothetical protein
MNAAQNHQCRNRCAPRAFRLVMLLADARRLVEQAASLGQRRPIRQRPPLAAPRQVPAAGAWDGADEHPPWA